MRAAALHFAIALAIAASLASQAVAQHAFRPTFDANAPVELSGTVTSLDWREPQAVIHLAASDAGGPARDWLIEIASPSRLPSLGLARSALTPGSALIVRGFRAKGCSTRAACRVAGRALVYSGGRTVYVGVADCGPRDTIDPTVAHPCVGEGSKKSAR